jgi:hypothetical protein
MKNFLKVIVGFILLVTVVFGAEKLIRNLTTTATSPASDDYMALDGATQKTRRILATTLVPTISGGAATYGNTTHTPVLTIDANGKFSAVTVAEIAGGGGGSGNVTNAGTLTDGNIVVGDGTTVIRVSGITIDASDNIVTLGNVTANVITGNNLTVTDFVTTNFTVSGNLASTTVTDGQIYIGDNADNRLELATITAGNGITITNGAGSITVTQKGHIREQFLTIDDLADSLNYGITYVTDAVTIVGIKGVHTGSGLSSPSIVATVKHGTDRTSGTTIEAVTVTSSTTGTADDGTLSDATVPAGSWIWVETSGKSGTTDNFELVIRYTHD